MENSVEHCEHTYDSDKPFYADDMDDSPAKQHGRKQF
jgi:hypothetical protein